MRCPMPVESFLSVPHSLVLSARSPQQSWLDMDLKKSTVPSEIWKQKIQAYYTRSRGVGSAFTLPGP